MDIARSAAPTLPVDPNQPTLPGLEGDVVARADWSGHGEFTGTVKVRRDQPVDAPTFTSFDDAVAAARTIMVADRREARWGFFDRNPGRVDSIALVQAGDAIRLLRTDAPVDPYKEPVPGQMFPGQNWWRSGPAAVVRAQPSTLALVGAEQVVDLRAGSAVPVVHPPH